MGAMLILDPDGNTMPSREKLKFGYGFAVTDESDGEEEYTLVEFDWGEDGEFPVHGNELHDPDFATEEDFQAHLDDPEPHGIDLALLEEQMHTQNTDTILDEGGEHEVSAEEIRALIDLAAQELGRELVVYSGTEYELQPEDRGVMADTSSNNVDVVLPAGTNGLTYTFRHVAGANAMTVTRFGDDIIRFNEEEWTGITTDVLGTWFELTYQDSIWWVTKECGLDTDNEAEE